MARPEQPIEGSGPLVEFARGLRAERKRANLTYRQMAQKCHYCVAALVSAANGKGLPTWPVAWAYLSACGVPLTAKPLWHARWIKAKTASAQT